MMLELMGWTGLRVSELSALRVDQVIEGGVARCRLSTLTAKPRNETRAGSRPLAEKLQGSLEGLLHLAQRLV